MLEKAAGDVDKLTRAEGRQTQSSKRVADQSKTTGVAIEDLRKRYHGFVGEVEAGNKSYENATFHLKNFQREFERLSRRQPAGSGLGEELNNAALAAKALQLQLKEAHDEEARAAKKAAQERVAAEREVTRAVQAEMRARESFERAADREAAAAQRERDRQLEREVSGVIDAAHRMAEARRSAERAGPARDTRGFLARTFGITEERLDAVNERIREFEVNSNRGGFSAVRLAGNLRGMVIVGILAFFQQLVSVGAAVATTLLAVAASASQAAVALAGAATAAGAQLLPVLGLLGAAWGRVGAVFDAVKQQQQALTSAAYDNEQALERQRSAADQVRNANEALSDATRAQGDAERGATEARRQATRQLEDLIAAQRAAQLQSESSVLAQEDAQRALRRAVAGGDFGNMAARSLDARSARAQAAEARRRLARGNADLAAIGGDVNNMEVVRQASRAMDDANRAAERARRGLESASAAAADAATETSAAQRQVDQLLAQLSPAERRLYVTLLRVRERYQQTFVGEGGVLESIIDAFTYGAEAAERLLGDQRVLGAATELADQLGEQIERIVDLLSSDGVIDFFSRMSSEAEQNLPIVVDLLTNIAGFLANVAVAASPALTAFLDFLRDLTGEADRATGSDSGLERLRQFFMDGERFAEDITHLVIALGKLGLALIGVSAEEGTTTIRDFTREVNKATAYINEHQEEVRDFFEDARKATYMVAGAIWALINAMAELYHPEQVELLAEAFTESLLPALTNVFRVVGLIAGLFLRIASSEVGGALVELAVTALLLRRVLTPIVTLFARLGVFLGTVFGSARLVGGALVAMRVATGPLGLAITAIAAILLLMRNRLDGVGDYLKVVGGIILGVTAYIIGRGGLVGAVAALTRGLQALAAAGLAGRLGALGVVFGGMLAKLTTLLARLPGVGRLLGVGGAAAGVAGVADDVGDAARAGSRVGTAARVALMGVLKKAGWVGVGISAAQGVISGFKHNSVSAGVRDFASSITFGLIDSTDEIANEAFKRLLAKINQGQPIQRTPGQAVEGLPGVRPPLSPRAIPRGPSGSPIPMRDRAGGGVSTDDERDWNRLTETQRKVILGIESLRQRVREFRRFGFDSNTFQWMRDELDEFVKKHPEATEAINKLEDRLMRFKRRMEREFKVSNVVTNFGLALQRDGVDVTKVTDDLIKDLKRLPKASRDEAAQAAIQMAQGLEAKGKLPKGSAEKIRDDVVTATKQMKERASREAARTASNTAKALNALATVVSIQFADVVSNVNSVLEALGADKVRFPKLTGKNMSRYARQAGAAAGDPLGTAIDLLVPDGKAGGGFTGRKGERGRDGTGVMVDGFATGRGEAVLNWIHQKAIEPAMAFTKRMTGWGYGSLDELFSKMRGEHSGGGTGFARGGFVQGAAGTRLSSLNEATAKLAAMLFKRGFSATSAIRSDSTTLHSPANRAALDFGDSVNNLRSLWQLLFPMRRRLAELGGPSYVSRGMWYRNGAADNIAGSRLQAEHEDHIHVGILGAMGRMARGVFNFASRAFDRLRAPKIGGQGASANAVRAAVDKITAAANRRIRQAGDAGDAFTTSARGSGRSLMQRIARERGWNFADWWEVDRKETNHGRDLVNETSTARLRGQFLDMNWGRFGPGSDPRRNPSMRQQIISMARYIAERYGNPSRALAHHLANNWYELGGKISGQGPKPIMAHGGEHVWTAGEVMRAGGHGVMRAMRSMLGGGGQGGPRSFQDGGEVYREPTIHGIGVPGISREIKRAQQIIRQLPSSLINRKANDNLSKSIGELTRDGGLLDQLGEAISTHLDGMSRRLKMAVYRVTRFGTVVRRISPEREAGRELRNLESAYSDLVGQRGLLQSSLRDVAKRLKDSDLSKGERNRLIGLRRTLNTRLATANQALADNLESRYQAVDDFIRGLEDAASTRAERVGSRLDLEERARAIVGTTAATAMGLRGPNQIGQARAGAFSKQADDLARAATVARLHGRNDRARELMDQVKDLRMQAQEAIAEGLRGEAGSISQQAERRGVRFDLAGRMADLLERTGNVQGAFAERGNILVGRAGSILTQRNALNSLLGDALAGGQTAVADELVEQIEELNVQLAENVEAQRQNTHALLQSRIDAIINRQSFMGGVFGGLGGLVNALGAAAGVVDIPRQRQLLQRTGGLLAGTGGSLRGQLFDQFGVDVRGAGPQQLVDALLNLDYDGIQANFSPEDKSRFQTLINAVIENATAVEQNTEQIKELTGRSVQAFSSTAWQRFRQAIFGGMGNLLPRYGIPSMDVGGSVWRDGMVYVHAGEDITPAGVDRGSGGDNVTENYYFTQPMEVADPVAIGSAIAWRKRGRPTTRRR